MTGSLQPETCIRSRHDDSLAIEGRLDLRDGFEVLGVEKRTQEAWYGGCHGRGVMGSGENGFKKGNITMKICLEGCKLPSVGKQTA